MLHLQYISDRIIFNFELKVQQIQKDFSMALPSALDVFQTEMAKNIQYVVRNLPNSVKN